MHWRFRRQYTRLGRTNSFQPQFSWAHKKTCSKTSFLLFFIERGRLYIEKTSIRRRRRRMCGDRTMEWDDRRGWNDWWSKRSRRRSISWQMPARNSTTSKMKPGRSGRNLSLASNDSNPSIEVVAPRRLEQQYRRVINRMFFSNGNIS